MDGTFKIVPEWYQQMFTIHVFIADRPDPYTASDISGDADTRLLIPFLPAVVRKVTDLGMRTSYIHEAATKKSQNVAGNGFFAAS
ncbi:hypothetical protein T09_9836 [Trichinella sp. T9]|nr:hypothetical protein T09_9836 [Trichinella sp. T9]